MKDILMLVLKDSWNKQLMVSINNTLDGSKTFV